MTLKPFEGAKDPRKMTAKELRDEITRLQNSIDSDTGTANDVDRRDQCNAALTKVLQSKSGRKP